MTEQQRTPLIIIIGLPGSGKGTQVKLLVDMFGYTRIAAGDFVRAAAAEDTVLGREMKLRMEQGIPQPDQVVMRVIRERLDKGGFQQGLLFDDLPLSPYQAAEIEELILAYALAEPKIFMLNVPAEVVVQRLASRRTCAVCHHPAPPHHPQDNATCPQCGGALYRRQDDDPNVVRERIARYEKRMKDIRAFYVGKRQVIEINGNQDVQVVHQEIVQYIQPRT